MPKLEFTPQELKAYFTDETGKHCYYKISVDQSEAMAVHADGSYPCKLLDERRPNEPEEVLCYRKTIFIPKTKPFFSKIISSLSKIRRSSDWSVRYEGEFPRIPEGETLQDYCEYVYPKFTSVTNWIYSVWLKKYLVDPNAVLFIYPDLVTKENEYLKPFPYIFDSCHVVDYIDNDFAVLVNPAGCTYTTSKGTYTGKSFFVVTTERIFRYDQTDGRGNYEETLNYEHGLNALPVYKIGAIINCAEGDRYLYESRIAGIIPEFDEAIREYSDLQAAKVLHIYPERWEYTQHECTNCSGTGKRRNPAWYQGCDASIACDLPCDNKACRNGYVVAGPYSKIMVRPTNAMEGQGSIPTPPAGFIEKDVEIVKVQEESIDKHIFNALASINFEFLMNTPLNQSGTAKEVDKDELNNTVHSIAEDMVRNMDWIYWITAKYRYRLQYDDEDIDMMLPTISVPEKYDILSATHLEEQLTNAKNNKSNPAIINALELEYSNKAFNSDPKVRDIVELVLSLDPLANITEDDKMSRLSNKGITQIDYVISSNINQFVKKAIEEDADFSEKDPADQSKKMEQYANELISKNALQVVDIFEEDLEEPEDTTENSGDNNDGLTDTEGDNLGKLPLAIQQLSLAATRATESGDAALAKRINKKVDEILKSVGV